MDRNSFLFTGRVNHLAASGLVLAITAIGLAFTTTAAKAQNPIVTENALAGNPPGDWDISGAGDESIQGFATDVSVDQGGTIDFKIKTDATDYRIDIYRMGYYGGLGARKVATVEPSATLPQVQPAGILDPVTKLLDCGNWAVSASWTVPGTAVSGVYIAKLVREDPEDGRASHIVFIVRDDDGGSEVLLQVSETTWQAYNRYSEAGLIDGNSLYTGPGGKADKVSFNRPFTTRLAPTEDWFFNACYPMIRWLERNGYDVSYFTDTDSDRNGTEILEHEVFLSVGHDEYWSRAQRENVEAARDAGVHLAFLSGNEIYWKIRWEDSVDGSSTPYRTMVCYKEGSLGENQCGTKCDPDPNVWTGLWRSGCAYTPPADGCEPENALSGQISWVGSTSSIQVPEDYARMPLWRNTSIASLLPGETATLPYGTLGYEWDFEQSGYASFYPPGRIKMSETTVSGQTHHLTLYRAPSGSLVFGAGTVQWSWGLDSNHDRGSAPEDIRMQQATVNLLGDMGVDAATLQAGLVPGTPSSDTTPPSSAITFPTSGFSVESGSALTVTGTASDVDGFVALVEVSTDGGATWFAADGFENWSYTWTPGSPDPVTVLSRATDGSLNVEAPGPGVSGTITPRTCPCGIWSVSVVPEDLTHGDTQAVEVGVKFQTDVDGYITALRFYKAPTNLGTHIGNLWAADGTNLATVVFTGESSSGWQEQQLDSPVAVTANTTYIASYHSTGGQYALDVNYFELAGVDNPPLRALADGEDGPNGVYAYSPTSAFPTSTWQSANYWVDVVFNETAVDLVPPTVTVRSPGDGAIGVTTNSNVSATFNEPVVEGTITFELRDATLALVPTAFSYNVGTRTATLDPITDLDLTSAYTASVSGAEDLAGNPMAGTDTWSFTTGGPPAPPPDEGPGGPILVISDAGNPFGRYFAEILRNEGLNEFTATDISLVTEGILQDHDVVILGEMSLAAVQVAMLTDWVNAGGKLIAMRPDKQLAGLMGLTDAASTLSDAYLQIDTGTAPGAGLVNETIQYHGSADLYTPSGAAVLATLYSDALTPTAYPAVTVNSVGVGGGVAAAFTYDLARSVVYTRQGNPAWEGQERDGIDPIRSDDMFYGAAAGDVQPDWIDLNKVAIPQADEQQRLLAQLILHMNGNNGPLPRFWYFPSGHKAVVIMTGDDHGGSGTVGRFQDYLAYDPPGCSLDDWECIRSSSYIYTNNAITDAQALLYHNQGFEIALHVNTSCANWTPASLEADYTSQLAALAAKLPSIPPSSTERNHCITWSDWASQPKIQYDHGIRLDTNYYYWPPAWLNNRPGLFTGSGMPMRFADLDGTMIDVYQATTQMTDESGQTFPFTIDALLDNALGSKGYYGAFCANMHTDNAAHAGSDAIVNSCLTRGVPVVSGRQMLTWLDGRNSSAFSSLAWNGSVLTFDLSVGTGATNLEAMLPTVAAVGELLSLTRDGSPVATQVETIKGVEYAFFSAEPGSYAATYLPDLAPPVISNILAAPQNNGSAIITWDTDEPANSTVDYGTDPGLLDQNASSAAFVTSHSLTIFGLPANTTIHYRVTSADGATNTATVPVLADPPLSFVTPPPVCFVDQTAADFSAGSPGANIYLAETADGEVMLEPAEGEEFFGSTLPAGWETAEWTVGGTAVVGGGVLSVNGMRANPLGLYPPGRSVEFVATFQPVPFQHVGFAITFNENAWAMFSTGSAGIQLQARTNAGGTANNTDLGASYLGSPHLYRVDWNVSSVDFYIDGGLVHTQPVSITDNMRPIVSDYDSDGTPVTVDWIRMTPFSSPGSFESRVYDAIGTANWGAMTWTSQEPTGSSISMFVRTGDTPVPDGSWTAYVPVAFSGATVGGSSQYAQYRADLATTDVTVSPVLEDVAISCQAGPDLNPPIITNVVATPGGDGTSASITWDTNEASDSRVDYGLDPGSLTLSMTDPALVAAHAVSLVGLPPGTPVYYRVTSIDGSSNGATVPPLLDPPLNFTTVSPPCFVDDLAADFLGGTTGADTYVSETGNGEVILAPEEGAEFFGSSLPPDWTSNTWAAGGTVVVGGGTVTLDAALTGSVALHPAGRSIEFVATFDAAAANQHAGLGVDLNTTAAWAIFSTKTGGNLFARTASPGLLDTPLSPAYLGSPHLYRIDWGVSTVEFYIDGALVATQPVTITADMRPVASDLNLGGASLVVDWMRMTPFSAAGSFESRVYDSGGSATWDAMIWTSQEPAGTDIEMYARTGDTPVPDGSWTAYTLIPTSASSVGGTSQFMQYRADLSTSDTGLTPVLEGVSVACTAGPDVNPPVITNIQAVPGIDGTTAVISWDTNEPADSRVDYGFDPGTLILSKDDATLLTVHQIDLDGLPPGTTVYYRVTSADAENNSATEPLLIDPPLSFITPVPVCFADGTAADFAAGTLDAGVHLAETGDGELILAPTEAAEFSGTALPPGWQSYLWNAGGAVTVAGGQVTVDASRVNRVPGPGYGPGRSLEFVATFAAVPYQHVGFGGGADLPPGEIFNTAPWVIFSTGTAGTALQARTWDGGPFNDFTIPGSYLGAPHLYRIDWGASTVDFYIDGAPVHSQAISIAGPMRPALSDGQLGGATLSVDWIRMTPYSPAGSFESRIADAGEVVSWGTASWSSDEPAGTGVSVLARTGNTAIPDGSWSSYTPILVSGDPVAQSGRFLQYRVDLSTGDPDVTPVFDDISFECVSQLASIKLGVESAEIASGCLAAGADQFAVDVTIQNIDPDPTDLQGMLLDFSFDADDLLLTGISIPAGSIWGAPGNYTAIPVTGPGTGQLSVSSLVFGGIPAGTGGVVCRLEFERQPEAIGEFAYSISAADVRDPFNLALDVDLSDASGLARRILGDFTATDVGGATDCGVPGFGPPNGLVDIFDLGVFSNHFGADDPQPEYCCQVDVGPTSNGYINGEPEPDQTIDFEDLIIFSISFGFSAAGGYAAPAAHAISEEPAVVRLMPVENAAEVVLDLVIDPRSPVQGLHAFLEYDHEVLRYVGAEVVEDAGFVAVIPGEAVDLNAAALGVANAWSDSAGVARLRFERLSVETTEIGFSSIDLRDSHNRRLVAATEALTLGAPTASAPVAVNFMAPLSPNPMRVGSGPLVVRFGSVTQQKAELVIFDVQGRRVRTLVNGPIEAGEHAISWDGRTDAGVRMTSGIYFARLNLPGYSATKKVVLLP